MRQVSRPPTWLRAVGVAVPLLLLAVSFSITQHVEPILIQALLALGLVGAFIPSTALAVVATMAAILVTDSALLPAATAALTLGVLWRVTTLVDRFFGVAFVVPLIAFRGEVMIPFWLWFLLIFPALIVIFNRKVLADAVASAQGRGPVDRNPSRTLNPVASVALERAGWPLVAEIGGLYLHSSPLPGTYALCTETFVFLVTRFGSRLLTTTNGAAGPDLPPRAGTEDHLPSSRRRCPGLSPSGGGGARRPGCRSTYSARGRGECLPGDPDS